MKLKMHFKSFLAAVLVLSTTPVFGQTKVIEGKYPLNVSAETNYVKNKGCYYNTAGITASGGTLARNTTAPLENGADCAIDASASAQTFSWSTLTFDRATSGQNCEARFLYKGDALLYKTYVKVNSLQVTQDLQLSSSTVDPKLVSINFPCGSQPLTTEFVIESTNSSAAAITVAQVYVGPATNLVSASAITEWISFVGSGSWVTNTTYSGFYRRVGGDMEVRLKILLSGAPNATTLTVNVPASQTIDTGRLPTVTAALIKVGDALIGDNGAFATIDGAVMYNSATTVRLHSKRLASGQYDFQGVDQITPFTFGNTDDIQASFKVPIVGWQGNLPAVAIQNSNWWAQGVLAGSNFSMSLTNTGGYVELANASETLTPASGSQPMGAMCSTTNAATAPSTSATTCSAGSESAGFNVIVPEAGVYTACAEFQPYGDNATNSALTFGLLFKLVETATNAQTIVTDKTPATSSYSAGGVTGTAPQYSTTMQYCRTFNFSSAGTKGFRLLYSNGGTSIASNSLILADGVRGIVFTMMKGAHVSPMPILSNSISSNSNSALRTEYAYITNVGSCAISSQSSNWLGTLTDPGVGQCGVVWPASTFASAPWCNCTMVAGSGPSICSFLGAVTTTGMTVFSQSPAAGGTSTDGHFYLSCTGPRP